MKGQKNMFWSIKYSGEVLGKLKLREFRVTSLLLFFFVSVYYITPFFE